MRVLKPSGSMFINLGDKYAGAPSGPRTPMPHGREYKARLATFQDRRRVQHPLREKSLLGLPWRYALACTDQLGLILRRDIVWEKVNGLPESVTDRCRSSHEYLFHLTRQPRYYAAIDEIREPHEGKPQRRFTPKMPSAAGNADRIGGWHGILHDEVTHDGHPLGKLPGSVWSIPSQPLQVPPHLGVSHFAAFPMELPRRCILGWSPPGVCTVCGQGRRPIHDGSEKYLHRPSGARFLANPASAARIKGETTSNIRTVHRIIGYACGCGDGPWCDCADPRYARGRGGLCECGKLIAPFTRPAVVLDPFGGTGTTALVASMLGRVGVSVDRSMDYARIARWRTTDRGEIAKAMQVPKPPPVPEGQEALWT
jgi:DNA modification methylase